MLMMLILMLWIIGYVLSKIDLCFWPLKYEWTILWGYVLDVFAAIFS